MSHNFEFKNIDSKPGSTFIVHIVKNEGGRSVEEKDVEPQGSVKISLDNTDQKLVIVEKQRDKNCSLRIWNLKNSKEFQITKIGKEWTMGLSSDIPPTGPPTVNIDVGPDPFGS